MKKLMMFAAAMTIVGGAYAQSECAMPELLDECALVYNVKMNLKTVSGKKASGSTYNAETCELDPYVDCIRFPRFPYGVVGYYVMCECDCDNFFDGEFYLWNAKLKSVLEVSDFGGFTHVLGKKNTAEILWEMEASDTVLGDMNLSGAGFGTFSTSKRLYSGFSGAVVGTLDQPICIGDCAEAIYWDCSTLTAAGEYSDDDSIIYGTFAFKVNPNASKSYLLYGMAKANLPSWGMSVWAVD